MWARGPVRVVVLGLKSSKIILGSTKGLGLSRNYAAGLASLFLGHPRQSQPFNHHLDLPLVPHHLMAAADVREVGLGRQLAQRFGPAGGFLAPTDPRLGDRVADNTAKYDITQSESLLFGRNFGAVTDIRTGPDGGVYVLSVSNGALYEISRR